MTLEGKNIVCISSTYWDENWLSGHQYMSRLIRKNRVLYVERPINILSFITSGQKKHTIPQLKRWLSGGIRQEANNLFIAAPPVTLPLRFESPMIEINQTIRRIWVNRIIKKLGFHDSILWIYDPDAAPIVKHMGEQFSIYAITDDHPSRGASHNKEASIRKWEIKLLEAVDLVITTAGNLAEMKKPHNANTHFVPHGVDSDHFAQALQDDYPIAKEIESIPAPRIGIVGQINQRIDIELIRKIAEQYPEWHIVFIGPIVADKFDQTHLAHLNNIHFVGRKSKEELPSYLKGTSACLIPYILDEHTRYMHPLKALEYLAAGKPVISTALPALQAYKEHLSITTNHEEFIAAIAEAIETDTTEKQQERSDYSQQHTWESRLNYIAELISQTHILS